MAFLFGRNKQRGAIDLCKVTKELLLKLNSDEPTPPKVEEDLAKNLAQMKLTVQGTPGTFHAVTFFFSCDAKFWCCSGWSIVNLPS